MSTYCTTTSLNTLMVAVSFDTATTNLATKCITQSETEIRKWLSKRYDLGVSSLFALTETASTPPIVTTMCEWYSEGLLWKKMSRGGKESLDRGNELIKMAMDDLKAVSEYKLDLIDTEGEIIANKSKSNFRVQSATTEFSNTFNEDDELNWRVDPDKIDAIESERS